MARIEDNIAISLDRAEYELLKKRPSIRTAWPLYKKVIGAAVAYGVAVGVRLWQEVADEREEGRYECER